MALYARVTVSDDNPKPWAAARRFYNAARRRDWWVRLDGRTVWVTDIPAYDIRELINKLGLTATEVA